MADGNGLTAGQGALYGGIASTAGNLVGGIMNAVIGSKQADKDWKRNYNAQKEFAQNSIQWRVQDAQKAGIHPLYAMGNSPGYTPSSSFNTESIGSAVARASDRLGDTMGQLGMVNAYLQNQKLEAEGREAQISAKNKELEFYNKLLERQQGQRPSMPAHITGQVESPGFTYPTDNGHSVRGVYADQVESEAMSLFQDLNKIKNTRFNREANNLPYDTKKNISRIIPGASGYEQVVIPKDKYNSMPESERAFLEALDSLGQLNIPDYLRHSWRGIKSRIKEAF